MNKLTGKQEILELTSISWACDCANWATKEDMILSFNYSEISLEELCVYIEPDNQVLKLPDTLGYNGDVIKFIGQFYEKKDFPEDFKSFQNPKKARVFRYKYYEVIQSNFSKCRSELENTKWQK